MDNAYELFKSGIIVDPSKAESGLQGSESRQFSHKSNRSNSQRVYELGVGCFFNARHYVSGAEKGVIHAHSWRIEVNFRGSVVNEQGMLVGFAEVKQLVQKRVTRFNGTILNEVEPFIHTPPTTENIAAMLYQEIEQIMDLPTLQLISVCVWESPTSYVLYREKV